VWSVTSFAESYVFCVWVPVTFITFDLAPISSFNFNFYSDTAPSLQAPSNN
jgi:hypothetical protein